MKPIIPIAVGIALAALLAPTVMNAQDYWDESYVEYTDRDLWTVNVSGYSCTYQPYSYNFGLEADSSLYGSSSGEIEYSYQYIPDYQYPYGACAYVGGYAIARGQSFEVHGDHFWYYYESEWYYDTSYYPTDYVAEIGAPQGETTYPVRWWRDDGGYTGGQVYAELYPDGYNYSGYEVEEVLTGFFDECHCNDPYGPVVLPPTPWQWLVAYDGTYRDDYIEVPWDPWVPYYSPKIMSNIMNPCSWTFWQDMYIITEQGYIWYSGSEAEVYLGDGGFGAAFRGGTSESGQAWP